MNAPDLPTDHGSRDRSIAVDSCTTVVGRASVPEHLFRACWRDAHGPLCSRVPGLGYYVQHHFARRQDAHLWPLAEGVGPLAGCELDGAVEIGWASQEEQARFQGAAGVLFSDEQDVLEETVAHPLPQGSTTVVDRDPDPVPDGADHHDRLHVHLSAHQGRAEDLARFVREEVAALAVASPEVVEVRVHAPDPHDNSTPNPPAPGVEHAVVAERVSLVVLEIAFRDPLARRRFFADDAVGAVLARQGELASAVTAFAVSGMFTFVRDGGMTTAGLRGSRVAGLVRDLAAANQVSEDVTHLLRTGRPR